MQCKNCGTKWDTQSRYCPTCGQLCTDPSTRKSYHGYLLFNTLLCFLAIPINDAEGSLAAALYLVYIWLWFACGCCVQSLAWKKGYNISFGWGYWLGIIGLLYWGFIPMEPTMQTNLIAKAIRQAQQPVDVQKPMQPMPVEVQKVAQTTPVEARLCASCGAKLKPGASFCSQCGSSVK